MIRVRAGSRIHCGLVDPAGASGRRFGGAGLMVDEPALELTAESADEISASGPLAERALAFARALGRAEPDSGESARGGRLEVLRASTDHIGLGTGTQLGLAVAAALARIRGMDAEAVDLARTVGRGERSAIGVHGFAHGGFLVDGGKARPDEIAPLIARAALPEEWRVVLVIPSRCRGLSGTREREAFQELARDSSAPETLSRILLSGALPALASRDLAAFGDAVAEYGRRAGELFRHVQGGPYASPLVADLVGFLRAEGAAGAGQSSWGPTTYAFVADAERAARLEKAVRERFHSTQAEVIVTRALNRGAAID